MNEMFTAAKGHGAFLNGKAISVSNATSMEQAVISTNVGYVRSDDGIAFLNDNLTRILKSNVRSLRSLGTSALEICSVACGRLDGCMFYYYYLF